jgi:hypothetical protein
VRFALGGRAGDCPTGRGVHGVVVNYQASTFIGDLPPAGNRSEHHQVTTCRRHCRRCGVCGSRLCRCAGKRVRFHPRRPRLGNRPGAAHRRTRRCVGTRKDHAVATAAAARIRVYAQETCPTFPRSRQVSSRSAVLPGGIPAAPQVSGRRRWWPRPRRGPWRCTRRLRAGRLR